MDGQPEGLTPTTTYPSTTLRCTNTDSTHRVVLGPKELPYDRNVPQDRQIPVQEEPDSTPGGAPDSAPPEPRDLRTEGQGVVVIQQSYRSK